MSSNTSVYGEVVHETEGTLNLALGLMLLGVGLLVALNRGQ